MSEKQVFSPRISLGNAITALGIGAGLVAGWVGFGAQLEALENDLKALSKSVEVLAPRVRTLETDNARTDERLTAMLDLLRQINGRLERMERLQ